MIRLIGRALATFALIALPTAAIAQKEPPDTKETKDAQKFLGLAMMRQTPEQKRPLFEQAMKPLQVAMTKNPDNGKVWFMAGQVYAGLGDLIGADSAFRKAEQLHPGYAEDLAGEREALWVEAFNAGITAMDAKNNDEAIKQLELAERLYSLRPEAKMNLGALYASKGDNEKAIKVFEAAIASSNGPLREKLKPEDQAGWKKFADMAKLNIAQIIGAAGVELFTAEKFDDAAANFTKASEINPFSRDYLFNLAQSHYAKASKLEEQMQKLKDEEAALKKAKKDADAKVKAEEAAKIGVQLLPIYGTIAQLAEKTLQVDPANEALFHLSARSYRMTGELVADAATKSQWQNKALEMLKKREELQFEVNEIGISSSGEEATVTGTVKNKKATAGAPLKLKITLLGATGTAIGSHEFTVAAPAVDATATFEGKIPVTGEVAGWKYEIVK